jgi:hypothetical protein
VKRGRKTGAGKKYWQNSCCTQIIEEVQRLPFYTY